MAATDIHISISAEEIFTIGGFAVTNSIFTSLIVSAILVVFAAIVRSKLDTKTYRPSGLQNFAEWLVESLHKLIYDTTGDLRRTRLFLPLTTTFFLWILLNNWLGLIPGVGTINVIHSESVGTETEQTLQLTRQAQAQDELIFPESIEEVGAPIFGEAPLDAEVREEIDKPYAVKVPLLRPGSADLNTTLALALISVLATQLFGFHFQRFAYFKKFINFSNPMMFFVGILELISEIAKVVSFSFRLFGNIFAGEVLLVVIAFLVPLIVPMPFYGLELFVGFIQALVFMMLSLVFFNMATHGHDDH
jgi:F-type H+-transporting ATPase subunit a